MTGTSAGASLCVYLAAMMQSPELADVFGVGPADLGIRAMGLASGMYYTTKMDSIGIFLPSCIYGKGWKKNSFYLYINPENKAILEHLPPSFLITVYGDSLRNYSRQYARAIQKSGGICHLEDLGPHKKLPHAFSTALPEIPESQYVNEKMVITRLKTSKNNRKFLRLFFRAFLHTIWLKIWKKVQLIYMKREQ